MHGSGRTAMRVARLVALALTLFVAAPAASGAATAPASYQANITVAQEPRYVGWAQVRDLRPGNAAPTTGHAAWRWSGRAWQHAEVPWGAWVYVHPFATGWSWAWTSSAGWLAIESRTIYLRTELRRCSDPVDPTSHAQVCRGINF